MRFAIIASRSDPAGMNMMNHLRELDLGSDVVLLEVAEKQIHAERVDTQVDADVLLFASRHSAASGIPSFSVHPIGNLSSEAPLGGQPATLVRSPALLMNHALQCINKYCAGFGHEITLEATHHGPYVEKPCLFLEIGSGDAQWANKEFGKAMALVFKDVVSQPVRPAKIGVGVGGTHYCHYYTKLALAGEWAVGHMCPKHQMEALTLDMFKQMIEKTEGQVEAVLADWKGLGGYKEKVKEFADAVGLEIIRTDKLVKEL